MLKSQHLGKLSEGNTGIIYTVFCNFYVAQNYFRVKSWSLLVCLLQLIKLGKDNK